MDSALFISISTSLRNRRGISFSPPYKFQILDDECEGVCFLTKCLLFLCFVELIFEGGRGTFVIKGKQVWQRVAEHVVLIMDASQRVSGIGFRLYQCLCYVAVSELLNH